MTIVDSSVWIDYFSNRFTPQVYWLETHIAVKRTGLTDLIFYEVLQGARGDARFAQLRYELEQFEILPTMTPGIEVRAARNYRELRSKGITVRKTVDCLVATFCIQGNHALLHNDRDYKAFEDYLGLKVVHPVSQAGRDIEE